MGSSQLGGEYIAPAPPALPNEPLAVRHSTATAISMAILLFLLSDILHLSLLPARLMGRVDIKKPIPAIIIVKIA